MIGKGDKMSKCGTCIHFHVKPPEVEIARQTMHISDCKPGFNCLGGQVRGSCSQWMQRAEDDLPMPWGEGPMVESTFGCKLWEAGGPSVKMAGSPNKILKGKVMEDSGLVTMGIALGIGIISSLNKKGSALISKPKCSKCGSVNHYTSNCGM